VEIDAALQDSKSHKASARKSEEALFCSFPARKEKPYIPKLPPAVRFIYDVSTLAWTMILAGLLMNEPWERKYGPAMVFLITCQNFFSFMGDSYEFMNTGCNGIWGTLDRLWAVTGVICSMFFASNAGVSNFGIVCYCSGMTLGMLSWACGVFILRIECDRPILWACFHIMWHVFLTGGGAITTFCMGPPPR
jgi:hypothetical protein